MGYRESEGRSGELSADCRGYELRDRDGEKIGKVEEVFVDENDRPEYLGVKAGLLGGKLTMIPADLARADDERRLIELSESRDRVKGAPSLGSNEEITAEREQEIRDHFGLGSSTPSATGGQSDSSPGYREESRSSGSPGSGEPDQETRSNEGQSNEGTTAKREPWSDPESDTSASPREERTGDPVEATEREDETADHGVAAGSTDAGEHREASDARSSDARAGEDNRETVRVSVWREKARAERVLGDDGSEEVRIRKEWVAEEEIVEVEGGRRGDQQRNR